MEDGELVAVYTDGEYQPLGPATPFEDIPRDEKQMAYELWAAAQHCETKSERRLRRGHLKSKFAYRHSQIKAAAKLRGRPTVHRVRAEAV